MKITPSEDYLKQLEEMLQTISAQCSDIADRRKELADAKIADKGFKAALQEGDYLLARIETEHRKIIKIINEQRDQRA